MGKVHDYVREFQVLNIECNKLNNLEKLYLFMCNLLPWAADELRRQRMETLAKAIAVADRLLDYKGDVAKVFGGG